MEVMDPVRKETAVYGKLVGALFMDISRRSTVDPMMIAKQQDQMVRKIYSLYKKALAPLVILSPQADNVVMTYLAEACGLRPAALISSGVLANCLMHSSITSSFS